MRGIQTFKGTVHPCIRFAVKSVSMGKMKPFFAHNTEQSEVIKAVIMKKKKSFLFQTSLQPMTLTLGNSNQSLKNFIVLLRASNHISKHHKTKDEAL